jgi:hypothetical protein
VRFRPRLAALKSHEEVTDTQVFRCSNGAVRPERSIRRPDGKPTVRQVYAIARLLLTETGEQWPANREEASELIERLRDRDEERSAAVPA